MTSLPPETTRTIDARRTVAALAGLQSMQRLALAAVYCTSASSEQAAHDLALTPDEFNRYLAGGLQSLGAAIISDGRADQN